MQRLVAGIHEFRRNQFSEQRRLFERLAAGQAPLALFITCSDSRINPNLLTQTAPGELFILRNAGNIVPPWCDELAEPGQARGEQSRAGEGRGAPPAFRHGGEAATIEYAVRVLQVKDIVICGHSHCGAMQAVLQPELSANLPAVRSWLEHASATRRIIRESYTHLTQPQDLLTATVEENVLVQLEHLRTHPAVVDALSGEQLAVHGWVYKFETGQVFAYEPEQGQFVPLVDPRGATAKGTESAAVF